MSRIEIRAAVTPGNDEAIEWLERLVELCRDLRAAGLDVVLTGDVYLRAIAADPALVDEPAT